MDKFKMRTDTSLKGNKGSTFIIERRILGRSDGHGDDTVNVLVLHYIEKNVLTKDLYTKFKGRGIGSPCLVKDT